MSPWIQRVAVVVALMGAETASLVACQLPFSVPRNRFDGVDERGYVEWFDSLGQLEAGKEVKIPLAISFRSDRETVSPYLSSKFFQLPLLESHIVALDEKTFRMVTPTGWFWYFSRGKPTDTTIKGADNWAGEIRGNSVTIWTDCGWRLEYINSKIITMANKDLRIDFVRSGMNGAVTELRSGGVPILKVEADTAGTTRALVYGDKRIGIEMASGQTVQGGRPVERTLKSLTLSDGRVRRFERGVKDGQPCLKIVAKDKEDRVFRWDAQSRTILSDNDWQYSIRPGPSPRDYAEIERKNSKNETERWFRGNGREEVRSIDGVTTIRSWFTSGVLAGRVRKIERITDGKTVLVYQASYDANARQIRKTDINGNTLYKYDSAGNRIEAVRDGNVVWRAKYDDRNRRIEEEMVGVRTIRTKYRDDGLREQTTTPAEGEPYTSILDAKGNSVGRRRPDGTEDRYPAFVAPQYTDADMLRAEKKREEAVQQELARLKDATTDAQRAQIYLKVAAYYSWLKVDPASVAKMSEAVACYERIIRECSGDPVSVAKARRCAAGLCAQMAGQERLARKFSEDLLAMNLSEWDEATRKAVRTYQESGFGICLRLTATGRLADDEKIWRELLQKYGDTQGMRQELRQTLAKAREDALHN